MTISEFHAKYAHETQPDVHSIFKKWANEKMVDDFLGTPLMAGVLIGDLLVGDALIDQSAADLVSPAVLDGFRNLMKEKADTVMEVRERLLEKAAISHNAVEGLISKVQGQMGEDAFINHVGNAASLAKSGSQEGWDVLVRTEYGHRYVQVKVFNDADGVIEKIGETLEKLKTGLIQGDGEIVKDIEFAVNDDIFDEVQAKVASRNWGTKIFKIGATQDELRSQLQTAALGPWDAFFGELLKGTASAAALHGAVNGFLLWKGIKDRNEAIEDTIYSTLTSASGIATSYAAELFLLAAGPAGALCSVGVGMTTRALMKRLFDRRFFAQGLNEGNRQLFELCGQLAGSV